MDIKNLLCPLSQQDQAIVLTEPVCPKTPTSFDSIRDYEPAFSYSNSPSMSSQYSSLPSLSPSSSPIVLPLMPARPVSQKHARNTSQTRTPWTPAEDYLLQQGYNQGLSWAMISSTYLPHRSRGCCWGRFKTLQTKVLEQREWTDAEDRLLMLAMKKHARLFKQAWKSVARDMGERSWRECEFRSAKVAGMIRKRHAM
ncbi:uncharacterized protein BYT42DRAFT_509050 [Radiomyces spectabilis]|uniref:uncharacterized protein n=1 Tax=Radiomyces spectabilis TaxID=64574 RepID=UPI0022207D92|nr:uncharacterized protein BYT42DRAFT_509050 [Radiomyces spectabilis]KAI8391177.1 hypothetical protein BYT42DRAFT_509050 [Radiomyces spectabilis]